MAPCLEDVRARNSFTKKLQKKPEMKQRGACKQLVKNKKHRFKTSGLATKSLKSQYVELFGQVSHCSSTRVVSNLPNPKNKVRIARINRFLNQRLGTLLPLFGSNNIYCNHMIFTFRVGKSLFNHFNIPKLLVTWGRRMAPGGKPLELAGTVTTGTTGTGAGDGTAGGRKEAWCVSWGDENSDDKTQDQT